VKGNVADFVDMSSSEAFIVSVFLLSSSHVQQVIILGHLFHHLISRYNPPAGSPVDLLPDNGSPSSASFPPRDKFADMVTELHSSLPGELLQAHFQVLILFIVISDFSLARMILGLYLDVLFLLLGLRLGRGLWLRTVSGIERLQTSIADKALRIEPPLRWLPLIFQDLVTLLEVFDDGSYTSSLY
jgi:hypothetical protein